MINTLICNIFSGAAGGDGHSCARAVQTPVPRGRRHQALAAELKAAREEAAALDMENEPSPNSKWKMR